MIAGVCRWSPTVSDLKFNGAAFLSALSVRVLPAAAAAVSGHVAAEIQYLGTVLFRCTTIYMNPTYLQPHRVCKLIKNIRIIFMLIRPGHEWRTCLFLFCFCFFSPDNASTQKPFWHVHSAVYLNSRYNQNITRDMIAFICYASALNPFHFSPDNFLSINTSTDAEKQLFKHQDVDTITVFPTSSYRLAFF